MIETERQRSIREGEPMRIVEDRYGYPVEVTLAHWKRPAGIVETKFLWEASQREQAAIDAAIKEIQGYIEKGNVDSQHEYRDLVKFVSQKHGVDPEIVAKAVKVQPKKEADVDHVIHSAWDLMLERLPKPILDVAKKLELRIEDQDKEDPDLDGQTFPEDPPYKGFEMYRNGAEVKKGRVTNIMQILAHETWHVFADNTKFYEKLEELLTGKIKSWMNYGVKDAEEFVAFIDMVENTMAPDFMKRLKEKIIGRPYWGESYFLEQADLDEMKGILTRVKSRTFLGAMDELMAESLGRIVAGKSLFVPAKMINFILKL